MPETQVARELQPDRDRDAGFRGSAATTAGWLLGLVFAAGFAIVLAIVLTRRRKRPGSAGRP